jgi:hypothetical protein
MFSGFEGTVREMSRSARVARSSLLSLVLLVSATASAQEPSDGLTSLPMTRYREAHAAMERSDWQEARAVLLELWQRSKSYDVAASLGEVEHALGNDVSAARYLTFAVAHLAPKERPETLTRYRAALRELEAQVGRVQVNVSEEAAEIRIDGNLVGLSPLSSTVFVTPGEHTIEARGQGSTASNRIEVSRGSFARAHRANVRGPRCAHAQGEPGNLGGTGKVTKLAPALARRRRNAGRHRGRGRLRPRRELCEKQGSRSRGAPRPRRLLEWYGDALGV